MLKGHGEQSRFYMEHPAGQFQLNLPRPTGRLQWSCHLLVMLRDLPENGGRDSHDEAEAKARISFCCCSRYLEILEPQLAAERCFIQFPNWLNHLQVAISESSRETTKQDTYTHMYACMYIYIYIIQRSQNDAEVRRLSFYRLCLHRLS